MFTNVSNIDDFQKYQTLIDDGNSLMLSFSASWCGPCKMLHPVLENLSNEEEFKNIIFLNSDVDDGFELAKKFNVKSIPSLLFFKKGKMLKHHVGFINKEELKIILKSL